MADERVAGESITTAVPLVRVEGKAFASGTGLTAERLVDAPVLLRASKTEATLRVEDAFGFGDCLYFYFGHACSDFGDIVLVFDQSVAEAWRASATPFDTGGLFHGYVHAEGVGTPEERLRYLQEHIFDHATWPARFTSFLNENFASASRYVLGDRPSSDEPTGRHRHPENVRRAWTWELQVAGDHGILSGLLLIALSEDSWQLVQGRLEGADSAVHDFWFRMDDAGRVVRSPVREAPAICLEAERRIASWL